MYQRMFKLTVGALAVGGYALTLHAQMAQDPLLSRTATVEPNIVFMFDNSTSMQGNAVYQYGGDEGTCGMTGPGSMNTSTCSGTDLPSKSPDVNLIYYDPRVRYAKRVNADGTAMTPSTSGVPSSWEVYFYGKTGTFKVGSVSVTSGGVYSVRPTAGSFPNGPYTGTGTRATVTGVSTTALPTTKRITGVSITNGGSYTTCPSAAGVSFSAPGSGGVQAAATAVSCGPGTKIMDVTRNNSLTFPSSCRGVTVSTGGPSGSRVETRNSTGGSGVAISATIRDSGSSSGRYVQSFTVSANGTGYPSTTQVRVTCGGTSRDYNVTFDSRVTGVTVNTNSGYTGTPTVTFPAGFAAATGTPTTADFNTWTVTGVTFTSGSKYTNESTLAPSGITLTNGTAVTPAVFNVTAVEEAGTGTANAKWPGTGASPTQTSSYFTTNPAGFSYPGYLPDASVLASGASAVPYPNTASSSITQYPKFVNRTDCAGSVCTWDEERANYIVWYNWHRTRILLAQTGVGLAFQPLNPTFRLGWGTINTIQNSNQLHKGVRRFVSAPTTGISTDANGVRGEFLTWLYDTGNSLYAGTPNRKALDKVGKYFQRQDNNGPWGSNPNGDTAISNAGTSTGHATCRRSYAMLMTDGYYNDGSSVTSKQTVHTDNGFTLSDVDSTTANGVTQPSPYVYSATGPYSDTATGTKYNNTLADVAMKYWFTDLRPDLANTVRTTGTDPAYWQHMNFYAIGLGVDGTLDSDNPAVLQSLTGTGAARTRSWPSPQTNSKTSIDDMWHATVNGRGKLISAKTSDDLNRAISQMMSDISGQEGTQAGVAISATALSQGARKYVPTYTPVSWTGNVQAKTLNSTGNETGVVAWEVETLVSTDPVSGKKTYESKMPPESHASRNIFVGNNATSGTRAQAFTYTGLGATLRGQMGSAAEITSDLIDYLRGSKAKEAADTSSSDPDAIYRARETRLGDIVNSTPVLVKDQVDLNYEALPDGTPGKADYRTYIGKKRARPEGVLFVGANDGMLHAFRDGTYNSSGVTTNGGQEVFAYVPYALLPTLKNLADKAYVHRYYVDGPLTETDVYIPGKGDNGWVNAVLGSTGAGTGATPVPGTSGPRTAVFAIDTTNLNTSVTGMDASNVLWEVNSTQPDFAELGYMLGDVAAGVTPSGHWVAIFGNGYESKSCGARLFVVNMATGARLKEISVGVGSCGGARNGLGSVRIVRNAQRQIVGVYAGDLQGNLWKFNLSSPTGPSAWGLDPNGNPLYATGTATKPITAPPSVLPFPMRGVADPTEGYMVVFGTGKFYEVSDISTTATQTLYGVWDKAAFGAAAVTGNKITPAGDVTQLVQQTISTTPINGVTYFTLSSNPVAYSGPTAKRGWYINLPNTGQRLVYPMEALLSRFVVADTMSPSNVSTDPCSNASGGTGYLYIMDAATGGAPLAPILNTNGDDNIDASDTLASGVETAADGRNLTRLIADPTTVSNDPSSATGKTYADEGVVAAGNASQGKVEVGIVSASGDTQNPEFDCNAFGDCAVPSSGGARRQWRQLYLR